MNPTAQSLESCSASFKVEIVKGAAKRATEEETQKRFLGRPERSCRDSLVLGPGKAYRVRTHLVVHPTPSLAAEDVRLHTPPYAKQTRGSLGQHEYLGHTSEVPFVMAYLSPLEK